MKVIREVLPEYRSGRGRYWRAGGLGYTNKIEWAGLYEAGSAGNGERYREFEAMFMLEDAIEEQRELLARLEKLYLQCF